MKQIRKGSYFVRLTKVQVIEDWYFRGNLYQCLIDLIFVDLSYYKEEVYHKRLVNFIRKGYNLLLQNAYRLLQKALL